MSTPKIVVVEYDPAWPLAFATLKAPIAEALSGIARGGTRWQHVGAGAGGKADY